MIDAIVAGHLCIDIIPRFLPHTPGAPEALLAPGRLVEVGEAVVSTGGAVSNTGLSLARLGLDVRLVARLGDDLIGGLTRQVVERSGAHLGQGLTTAHGEPSSYTVVISPPGVDRIFLHCPGTNNTFGPEDVDDALLAGARLFHFGYPPIMRRMYADGGAELEALLSRAARLGATTSLDLSLPDAASASGRADWPAILARALPHVHLFLPSAEELQFMLDRPTYEEALRLPGGPVDALTPEAIAALADRALGMGARVVGLKLGHRGLYLRTAPALGDMGRGAPAAPAAWAGREAWAPCFSVPVASTVGSGDATIAGLLGGLLRGQGPFAAMTTAVAVGACNVEAADATSGVRTWEDTQERVRAGWPRLEVGALGGAWRWEEAEGVWLGPRDASR